MKRLFLLLFSLSCISILHSQSFERAFDLGGASADQGRAIDIDPNGNVYMTGSFRGTVDMDPGGGVTNLTSRGTGVDFYVTKYNAAGALLWTRNFGDNGNLNCYPIDLVADAAGNVYITGIFRGTVDFYPGLGTVNRTSNGQDDVFLLKLSTAGNYNWVVAFGGSAAGNTDAGHGLAIDNNGDVFLTGGFEGTANFNPRGAAYNLSGPSGADNAFIAKYTAGTGICQWARVLASNSTIYASGESVAVDAANNVYVCGGFTGTSDFNGAQAGGVLTSFGNRDIFLVKFSNAGGYFYARRMGGTFSDDASDLKITSDDNLVMTGKFFGNNFNMGGGTILNSNGSDDAFLTLINSANGFPIWAFPLGGTSNDLGTAVEVSGCGNIIVAGYFSGTADFNPGAGTFNMTGAPSVFPLTQYSYFLAKYNESGSLGWAGTSNAASGSTRPWDLALDGCEAIHMIGQYNVAQDFNITSGTFTRNPAGSSDIFYSKHTLPVKTVTNTSDTGEGTLRNAITCANLRPGRDTINFCFPGNFTHTISPLTALPYVTDDTTIINGTSQPNYTLGDIVINGTNLPGTNYGLRFDGANECGITGMSIRNFDIHGIYFYNSPDGWVRENQIGSNGQDGLRMFNSQGMVVQGNYIGINANGSTADGNGRDGIAASGTSADHYIGGILPGEGNVVSSNVRHGMYLIGNGHRIYGNMVGTRLNGTGNRGNGNNGILLQGRIVDVGNNNANSGNIIAYNSNYAIEITNSAAYTGNWFSRNSIFCNTLGGIQINAGNAAIATPVITLPDASGIYGTSIPNATIQLFEHDPTGCLLAPCQGKNYLGAAVADAGGNWVVPGMFTPGMQVTVTARDGSFNTSNFSICEAVGIILSVGEIVLEAKALENATLLEWTVEQLQEPAGFEIERSKDGMNWDFLGIQTGETTHSEFSYRDNRPVNGVNYYRIKRLLNDGSEQYSSVVSVTHDLGIQFKVYPTQATDFIWVEMPDFLEGRTRIEAVSSTGQIVHSGQVDSQERKVRIETGLWSQGAYWVIVNYEGVVFTFPVLKH